VYQHSWEQWSWGRGRRGAVRRARPWASHRNSSASAAVGRYLRQRAGSAVVRVERRGDAAARFGRARAEGEVELPLGELLTKIEQRQPDAGLYYLTTQPIAVGECATTTP
jgi:hypothetical protein